MTECPSTRRTLACEVAQRSGTSEAEVSGSPTGHLNHSFGQKITLRYLTPEQLLEEVQLEKAEISALELFTRAGEKYTRHKEKWCAAIFGAGYAQHIRPCLLAMNDRADDEADFFLRIAGEDFPFQITEVLEEERRRSQEYRQLETEPGKSLHFEPIGIEHARRLIELAAARKVGKHYSTATNLSLLLYVNVGVFGLPYTTLVEAALTAAISFRSCWAITSRLIACVQSDDKLGSMFGWGAVE